MQTPLAPQSPHECLIHELFSRKLQLAKLNEQMVLIRPLSNSQAMVVAHIKIQSNGTVQIIPHPQLQQQQTVVQPAQTTFQQFAAPIHQQQAIDPVEQLILQTQPPGTVIKCFTAQVIKTQQSTRVVLKDLRGSDLTPQQSSFVQQQVEQRLLNTQESNGKLSDLESTKVYVAIQPPLLPPVQSKQTIQNQLRPTNTIMERCPVCTVGFTSGDDRVIECSGQRCGRRRFHSRCVLLTEANVRSWLDKVGLLWFCDDCRLHFDRDDSEIAEPLAKRAKTEEELPLLPPEVWMLIFEQLSPYWLQRVRLVCRDWRNMVSGSRRLMDNFKINLNWYQDNYVRKFFKSGADGYTKASISSWRTVKEMPFKSSTLHTLECVGGTGIGQLVRLMNGLPNLKRLTFARNTPNRIVKLDSQFNNIEYLCLRYINSSITLNAFSQICPRLKTLILCEERRGKVDENYDQAVVSFIKSVRATLQKLEIAASSVVVNGLVEMQDLNLKEISLNCSEMDVLRLLRHQHGIVSLDIERVRLGKDSPVLQELADCLPDLKELQINAAVQGSYSPAFQRALIRLERFTIHSHSNPNLGSCSPSHLQHHKICKSLLGKVALLSLQRMAINITHLHLQECTVPRASDILTLLLQAESLTNFEMRSITMWVEDVPPEMEGHSNVRSLTVSKVSKAFLLALVKITPKVESFCDIGSVSDTDVIRAMGLQWPQLRNLQLSSQNLTVRCIRLVSKCFEKLNAFGVKGCRIFKDDVEDVVQEFRKDVEVTIQYAERQRFANV